MSKKQSDIVKGIAILFMVFHHLFMKEARYEAYHFTGLIINQSITVFIAEHFKVCVSLFAFLSGYGMEKKTKNAVRKGTDINAEYYEKSIVETYLKLIRDTSFLTIFLILLTMILVFKKHLAWFGEKKDCIFL